ncbi:putative translocon-associated protein subunit delta [Apostichopus japonicus]|uniref:Translocon-associated protein subunit delta n=1 Tax=Stichopus japonicus TaxID=307972 RepID=A0A2G8LF19_STIJA|nr:putative translocon-associated protein subunit delta [Apostichopus japonicus]PIK58817.1 putative translocon-associated protein subunit delta [Apostichopus japonicus]
MASLGCAFVAACLLLLVPFSSAGESCLKPTVEHQIYTTTEAVTSTDTVFLVEFDLKCSNAIKNPFLYADVSGRQLPVSRSGDNLYQVSWVEERKNAPAGTYTVKLFDEEGFSALRKAQRAEEDVSTVTPLTSIAFSHKGVSQGPIVSSELLAVVLSGLLWYAAYSAKQRILS